MTAKLSSPVLSTGTGQIQRLYRVPSKHQPRLRVEPGTIRCSCWPGAHARCGLAAKRLTAAAAGSGGPAAGPATAAGALPELSPLDSSYEGTHSFSGAANWLVPGRFMVGRYPYVDPHMIRTRERGEANLQQVLDAGITTFVCLQGELPPQPQMPVRGVRGFMPYSPTATALAAAAGHVPAEEVAGLRNRYLDSFLPPRRSGSGSGSRSRSQPDATEGPAGDGKWDGDEERNGFAGGRALLQFQHFPITDLSVPSPELAATIVEDLTQRLRRGENVYLHCWGGIGRAGTLGACLLGSGYGLGAGEALERVQRAYDTRGYPTCSSPETDEQQQFVRDFIGRS